MSGGRGIGNAPAFSEALDGPRVGEPNESVTEAFVADAKSSAEVSSREWSLVVGQGVYDGLVERDVGVGVAVRANSGMVAAGIGGPDDVEMDILVTHERETDGVGSGRSAVLNGEEQLCAAAPDEQQRICPRKEVAGAAQTLSGLASGAILTRVVHDEDGYVVGALQLAQIAEQRGDLTGVVFVDAMQAHKGIEHEHSRRVLRDSVAEPPLVVLTVEPQRGGCDEVNGEVGEVEGAVTTDACEARLDDGRGVLGHVEEHGAHVAALEDAEARDAARNGDRHLEREPRLADGMRRSPLPTQYAGSVCN